MISYKDNFSIGHARVEAKKCYLCLKSYVRKQCSIPISWFLVQWADTNILEDFPISKGCFEAERSLSCSPNLLLTLFHDLKTEGGFYSPKLGLYLSSEPRGNTVQHGSKDKEEPSLFRCRMPQLLCESYCFFPSYACGQTVLTPRLSPFQLWVTAVPCRVMWTASVVNLGCQAVKGLMNNSPSMFTCGSATQFVGTDTVRTTCRALVQRSYELIDACNVFKKCQSMAHQWSDRSLLHV